MSNRFLALLAKGGPVTADGGMGTMLMSAGLLFGDPPEQWNTLPDKRPAISAIHRGYLDAGAQIILTNSFGGNPFRLKLHNLDGQVFELNRAAAELARIEAGDNAVVAGSIGPSGELFEPIGTLTYDAAVAGFAAQAEGLAAGGADVLWVETMSDLREVRAAVEGAQQGAPGLPVVATLTFDTRGFTMMGVSPSQAIEQLADLGLAAIGGNCGNGTDEIEGVISAMHQANPSLTLIAKSNAGIPEIVDERAVYSGTPDIMASYARRVRALGATIIGACCGSTPAHIQAINDALNNHAPLSDADVAHIAAAAQERYSAVKRTRTRQRSA